MILSADRFAAFQWGKQDAATPAQQIIFDRKSTSGSVFENHGISTILSGVMAVPYASDSAATTIVPAG